MIIRCSCRSSFRSLLHFHAQNSRHISRPPRSVRGKKRGKPLIYIAPYLLGASRSSRSDLARLRPASSCSGFVRPLCGVVRLRLEYWQGLRRRPRVCGCGWWSAGPPCGGLAGLGANLARRGRFRDRWRRCGLRLVCTLAAFLGACWRPFYGPCGGVAGVGLSVLLAWPLRAARGWRWRRLDRLRVVLAAVAVWTAPAAAVAVAGASIKRARRRGPCTGRGGVAPVAWSGCQRTGAAGVAGAGACVVAVAGVEPAASWWRAPMVTTLPPLRAAWF